YVHCTAGISRSPTVVAAYLHWRLKWPLERALAALKEARECTPNELVILHARLGAGCETGETE
ncbi:MAG: dual specificity protein phosphatase family protein, partial [Candidatus Sulfotelmatobacter sp.]